MNSEQRQTKYRTGYTQKKQVNPGTVAAVVIGLAAVVVLFVLIVAMG
ncbi:hypothetical protein [Citricoccus alkalitolerans]|uniref:Uncharacterized protein n=1 Tax=Citricoccus alkalitolerans TaxID=246603 RepID=A0ABV8XS89_9MICC